MSHTPGPWEIGEGYGCFVIFAPQEISIEPIAIDLQKVDAEFIIRACNSHYDLLEACRITLKAFEPSKAGFDVNWAKMEIARHRIKQAIGKAEGKE